MKVILVFVSTLDGKITRWGFPDVRSWSSPEDQMYFTDLMKRSRLVVMGSNTFTADQTAPEPGRLVVIMTSRPDKYYKKRVPGMIEFSSESPYELVKRFGDAGYEIMLMVGGPKTATSFLKDGLIDEIWLTLEPKVFGSGGNFAMNEKLDITLKLLNTNQVNNQGSLILKYEVIKST